MWNGRSHGAILVLLKSKMAAVGHLKEVQKVISLKCSVYFTLRTYTDHTLPAAGYYNDF